MGEIIEKTTSHKIGKTMDDDDGSINRLDWFAFGVTTLILVGLGLGIYFMSP